MRSPNPYNGWPDEPIDHTRYPRSVRAAGFTFEGYTERERPEGFSRPSRPRAPAVRPEVKGRWKRVLRPPE